MHLKRPEKREHSENIIPLINIVFLLLIFFMVTAKLAPQDPFEIKPPKSILSIEEKKVDGVLYLSIDGQLAYNNQPVSKTDLLSQLDPGHFGHHNIPLRFKADAQTPVTFLMEIIRFLKKHDIKNIELLTLKDG